MVYSHRREQWCLSQTLESLQQLAAVAHRLGCVEIMEILDEALVLMCSAEEHPELCCKAAPTTCLTPTNVADLHALAAKLQLPGEARCMHMHWPRLPVVH